MVPDIATIVLDVEADGSGRGDGTDISARWQAAYDRLDAMGGGRLVIPASGRRTYRHDGTVFGYGNITTILTGATIDTTNCPWGVPAVYAAGTIGPEVRLAVPAKRHDMILETEFAHDMHPHEHGLLKSTIDSLSSDAGLDWRLGTHTTTPQKSYFGEFFRAAHVPTATAIALDNGLLFPSYPLHQVGNGLRACSTIAKVSFVENFWIEGGVFIRAPDVVGDGPMVLFFQRAKDSGVRRTRFRLGRRTGASIRFEDCLDCRMEGPITRRPHLNVRQGAAHNSYRVVGSQNTRAKVYDLQGVQGFDETYMDNGHPCIGTKLSGKSYLNSLDAWTSHGGSHGLEVDGFYAHLCLRAFTLRARFFSVRNVHEYSRSDYARGSMRLGSYACDGKLEHFVSKGAALGMSIMSTLRGDEHPRRRNLIIGPGALEGCRVALDVLSLAGFNKTDDDCGIELVDILFDRAGEVGLRIGAYNNALLARRLRFTRMTGSGPVAIDQRANAARVELDDVRFDCLGELATALRSGGVNDTEVFASDRYRDGDPMNSFRGLEFEGALGRKFDWLWKKD